MKVVSGVSGFVGSHLAEVLLARGDSVLGIDKLINEHTARLIECGMTFLQKDCGDITIDELKQKEIDCIYHLAAVKKKDESLGYCKLVEANVNSTANLLDLASEINSKFIYTSSLYAYGNYESKSHETDKLLPRNLYGASKAAGEMLVMSKARKSNNNFSIARLYFVVGDSRRFSNYENVINKFVSNAIKGEPISIFGTGNSKLNYVWIGDVITSLINLGELEQSQIINIANDQSCSVLDIAQYVAENFNAPIVHNSEDWTEGLIRDGDNSLLKAILPSHNFLTIKEIVNTLMGLKRN